jgi:hypothetical protein
MKAGPELDALVAEKVMGWEIWRHPYGQIEIITEDDTCEIEYFKPSTDMKTAWEVVEKFFRVDIETGFGANEHCVTIRNEDGWTKSYAYAKTVQLAICLAALKAVGVEVDHD